MNDIQEFRESVRSETFTQNTSGILSGLVQGNVVILPKPIAQQFVRFCELNPTPCPIIAVSTPGDFSLPNLGLDIDIRRDLPEYHLFREGIFSSSELSIEKYWQQDSVAIVLGCSFSFELALKNSGIPVRNADLGLNVSMFDTTIKLKSTDHFSGHMVVSMRPFKSHQIDEVVRITQQYAKSHGGPVHIGDPSEIGIKDVHHPDYGEAVPLEEDDVLVFWGCGVTTQRVLRNKKLPLLITHAPGKMLVTDHTYQQLFSV